MKISISLFLFIICISCNTRRYPVFANETGTFVAKVPLLNYDSCKKEIDLIKQTYRAHWNKLSKQEKEKIFTKTITENIIPSWIGTPWDFNGITQKPQQGKIACGYFDTTVLRDGGVTLARVKLAQCAAESMILKLIQPKYVQRYSNIAMSNFIAAIQVYGLYIVGLDNHVGFIYNDSNEIYFIQSSVVGTRNVQKEKAVESWVLIQSKYKVLGKLSADENVLNKWINS